MIKRYYSEPQDSAITEVVENRPGLWLHAESPTKDEIAYLVDTFHLTPGHIEDALDEDEVPRLEAEEDQLYMYVRFAVRERDGDFETFPLLIIILEDALITIAARRVTALDSLLHGKLSATTQERNRLVLHIMQQVTEQYDNLIDKTSRKIKAVRQRLRTHAVTNQDFVDFVMIEDELNEFLTALQPNNAVLRRLLLGHRFIAQDQDLVEDVLLMNEQSVEKCNTNIKSIIGVRDAHSSISDNSLNQTMKVLTVATLCIAIPNMFFGLYSMNVETPFQSSHSVFWIIIGFTIVLTLAVYAFGRKKGIF